MSWLTHSETRNQEEWLQHEQVNLRKPYFLCTLRTWQHCNLLELGVALKPKKLLYPHHCSAVYQFAKGMPLDTLPFTCGSIITVLGIEGRDREEHNSVTTVCKLKNIIYLLKVKLYYQHSMYTWHPKSFSLSPSSTEYSLILFQMPLQRLVSISQQLLSCCEVPRNHACYLSTAA